MSSRQVLVAGRAAAVLAAVLAGCATELGYPTDTRLAVSPARAPMVHEDGVPLVQVHVGGAGPFVFKLDTGAGPAIVSTDLVARLGLATRADGVWLSGANGRARAVEAVVSLPVVTLGPAGFHGVDAYVLPASDLRIGGLEPRVDGILGFSVFKHCTLTLDYPRSLVELSLEPLPDHDGVDVLPLLIRRKTPRVAVRLHDRPVELLLDSGNDQCLILGEDDGASLPYADQPVVGPLLSTISGMSRVRMARLDGALLIGRHRVSGPLVAVMPGASAMLGGQILSHFRVSFDTRNARVRFERDGDWPIEVPSRLSDGLGLRRERDGWLVVDVIPDSPAAAVGIRIGDMVRTIGLAGSGVYRVMLERDGLRREVEVPLTVLVR